jgi:hypothetical protein
VGAPPRRSAAKAGGPRGGSARERVVAIVRALPEGAVVPHDEHLSLEVRKKRFGWFLEDHHDDGRLALHCRATAALRTELEASAPSMLHVPKYTGHRGWIGLWLDVPGVAWSAVERVLTEAWRATAPKALAKQLPQED